MPVPSAAGRRPVPLRRQVVALAGLIAVLAALVLVVVVQVLLAGTSTELVDQVLGDRAEALVSATDTVTTGSRLTVPDSRLDPGVAVYDADGRPVAGTVPPRLRDDFAALATVTAPTTRQVHGDYAVTAVPFATGSGARGVAVLAEPLAPYEAEERDALIVSLVAGAVMVGLALALSAWAMRRALAPVGEMARLAEDWSEHDLGRRFQSAGDPGGGGPGDGTGGDDDGDPVNPGDPDDAPPGGDELAALARTLDRLLDKVAGAIRAEQRLTSELAHELRTPLTAVQATADLMAQRDDLDEQLREDVDDVRAACRTMATTITVLIDLARQHAAEGGSCTTAEIAHELRRRHPDLSALDLDGLERPAGRADAVRLGVRPALAVRALAPVVDNALRVATHVRVHAVAGVHRVDLVVDDDGPGVAAGVQDRLFTPGASTGGSGLGLALARRVARSLGGDVRHEPRPGPEAGARFVVTLPRADA